MKTLFKILVILAIGELVFQLHKHWGVEQVNDIPTTTIMQVDTSSANTIFLLGDSYTKGMGVKEANRIVNNIHLNNHHIADYSHSSHNWADYINVIKKEITPRLKPQDVIVIGVNWNDVNFKKGSIDFILHPEVDTTLSKGKKTTELLKKTKPTGFRGIVHFFYRNSAMVNFLSSNIQNTLRRKGIPLPIGDFHYYKEIAYHEKGSELDSIMTFLKELNNQHQVYTLLYLMPDFNLTKNIEYFEDFTRYFGKYNEKNGIIILDGPSYFQHTKDGHYCISKHDGHPNDDAHQSIARQINKALKTLPLQ